MFLALVFGLPLWALIMSVVVILGLFALIELEKPGIATITVVGTLITLQFVAGVDIIGAVVAHPIVTAVCILSYFVLGVVWAFVNWWFYIRNERDRYETRKVEFLKRHRVSGTTVPDELKEAFLAEVCAKLYEDARQQFFDTHHSEFREETIPTRNINPRTVREPGTAPVQEATISPEQAEWLRIFRNDGEHFSLQSRINYVGDSTLSNDLKVKFRELLAGPQFKEALIPSAVNNKARIMMWMTWWPWSALWTLLNDPIKRAFRALFQALKARFQKMSEYAFRHIDDDLVIKTDSK